MIDRNLKIGVKVRLLAEDPPNRKGRDGTVERISNERFWVRYDGDSEPNHYAFGAWPKDFLIVASAPDAFGALLRAKQGDAFDLLIRIIEEQAARIRDLDIEAAQQSGP